MILTSITYFVMSGLLMSEVFRHDNYVNVDVAKTGDNSSLHSAVIKAPKVLHEQGFIPVFNYD